MGPEAARLKAEGVVSGVPDLFVPAWGVWIEMKKPGGRVSKAQQDWLAYLDGVGFETAVCFGADEAKAFLAEQGNLYTASASE